MRTPEGSVILWVTPAGTTLPRSMPSVSQSFFSLLQKNVLDRRTWSTRAELASAIFEWIEAFYNPLRRHSGLGYRSPNQFEDLHSAAAAAA